MIHASLSTNAALNFSAHSLGRVLRDLPMFLMILRWVAVSVIAMARCVGQEATLSSEEAKVLRAVRPLFQLGLSQLPSPQDCGV